jgi:hypothetical protein
MQVDASFLYYFQGTLFQQDHFPLAVYATDIVINSERAETNFPVGNVCFLCNIFLLLLYAFMCTWSVCLYLKNTFAPLLAQSV